MSLFLCLYLFNLLGFLLAESFFKNLPSIYSSSQTFFHLFPSLSYFAFILLQTYIMTSPPILLFTSFSFSFCFLVCHLPFLFLFCSSQVQFPVILLTHLSVHPNSNPFLLLLSLKSICCHIVALFHLIDPSLYFDSLSQLMYSLFISSFSLI